MSDHDTADMLAATIAILMFLVLMAFVVIITTIFRLKYWILSAGLVVLLIQTTG